MALSPRSFLLFVLLVASSVIGGAWCYTRFMGMAFLESGYPLWVAKQEMLRHCDFGSILVLGDSRAEAGIVPAVLPFPAANIAFGGTTPVETYFFAQTAMKCPKPRLVVYSHSITSYMYPNLGLWKTAVRFGFIGFRQLREIADVAAREHDTWLAAVNTGDGLTGIVRDITYGIGFPSIFVPSLVEARGVGRYEANMALLERTAVTRGQVIYPQPQIQRLVGIDADQAAFVPSPLEAAYFDKTLELFAAAHVRVLLLTVPAGESTVRAIPPALMADYSGFLAAHIAPYRNVTLATPGLLGWPDDFYVDGSHMSEAGAKVFTARLGSCLKQWGEDLDRPAPCDLDWK
jgi:hypothetical protein